MKDLTISAVHIVVEFEKRNDDGKIEDRLTSKPMVLLSAHIPKSLDDWLQQKMQEGITEDGSPAPSPEIQKPNRKQRRTATSKSRRKP